MAFFGGRMPNLGNETKPGALCKEPTHTQAHTGIQTKKPLYKNNRTCLLVSHNNNWRHTCTQFLVAFPFGTNRPWQGKTLLSHTGTSRVLAAQSPSLVIGKGSPHPPAAGSRRRDPNVCSSVLCETTGSLIPEKETLTMQCGKYG